MTQLYASARRPRNPYDFVPLEAAPTLGAPTRLDRASGHCGTLSFTLEVLTPLCVQQSPGEPQNNVYRFTHLGGRSVLPATSLKGMLRSVHEALTNSTMGLLASRRGWYRTRVPKPYLPGGTGARLTPTEALFGTVGGEGTAAVGYAGRLLLADIPIPGALTPQAVARPQGGQPKPEHESFYFLPGQRAPVLGRKFYYHQRDYGEVLDIYGKDRRMPTITVEAVPPGTLFHGQLRFLFLSEEELAALVYTLVLEETLAHKLGYGKPLGLGSVRLRITSLLVERSEGAIPARFTSYDPPAPEERTEQVGELRDAAREFWVARPGGSASYGAFAAIARWPQQENFVYPDFKFFQGQRGAPQQTTLWNYQGRPQPHPGGVEPGAEAVLVPAVDAVALPDVPAPVDAVGMFSYADDIGYYVRDEADGARCQSRSSDRKLMLRLRAMLDDNQAPRVTFRRETDPEAPGREHPIATNLRLL